MLVLLIFEFGIRVNTIISLVGYKSFGIKISTFCVNVEIYPVIVFGIFIFCSIGEWGVNVPSQALVDILLLESCRENFIVGIESFNSFGDNNISLASG